MIPDEAILNLFASLGCIRVEKTFILWVVEIQEDLDIAGCQINDILRQVIYNRRDGKRALVESSS